MCIVRHCLPSRVFSLKPWGRGYKGGLFPTLMEIEFWRKQEYCLGTGDTLLGSFTYA